METAPPDPYDVATKDLDKFGQALGVAITAALDKTSVTLHGVPYRVKTRQSAVNKLLKKGLPSTNYSSLSDLLGVRVITLFEDDLDTVAKTLTSMLDLDETSDKRDLHAPNAFGYRSLHFVGKISRSRAKMIEYSKYASLTVEIQARSILQHAWAEIEHDLGYKPDRPLDEELRRQFSRLAALIEIGDTQFSRLRSEVVGGVPEAKEVERMPEAELSVANLTAHIRGSRDLTKLDRTAATVLSNSRLPEGKNYRRFVGHLLDMCLSVGWRDLAMLREVESAAVQNAVAWASKLTAEEKAAVESAGQGLRPGFSIAIAAQRSRLAGG